ncbi:MAG: ABC transporter ATP-binding protein [Oscillospiraceae bacterium]
MNDVLKIENLTKYFGKKKVLDNISFELKEGEVFGFLGPNGVGKTTTIKIITGFLSSDSGSVQICGYELNKNYEKAISNIGAIVENPEMYKDLTGYCNLRMYARLHDGVTKERINEVVKMVGLENRINDKVKKYSLGMKQRLGLAQSMLHQPKVLILDEPTNGLDPSGIKELRDILKKLAHEDKVAVLVSSHLLSEMELMCDRVAIINNGKVLDIKTVDELKNKENKNISHKFYVNDIEKVKELLKETYSDKIKTYENDFIELYVDEENAMKINKLLVLSDVDVLKLEKTEVSLEDVFMDIIEGGDVIA